MAEIIRETICYLIDENYSEPGGHFNYDEKGNVEVCVRLVWKDAVFGEWHEIYLPNEFLPYDESRDECLAFLINGNEVTQS